MSLNFYFINKNISSQYDLFSQVLKRLFSIIIWNHKIFKTIYLFIILNK